MSRFSIEATFRAIDKMTGPVKRMAQTNSRFTKQISKDYRMATRSADQFTRSLNQRANTAMKRTAQVGLATLGVGLAAATKQYIEFDDAIFQSSAKFKDLNLATEEGQKTMDQLRKTARKVGADTKFNAIEAAQGLDFLAMAGFNTTQAMASLPGVVALATVANTDLATATDIASDTLGAFNLMTEDSIQLQTNLTRVNDVAAKTTTMFNTTLEGLFEAVKKGGPTFTSTGQTIESFSTLVGVMANAGVKGEESGTQLRNIMLRLAGPTGKAAGLIKQMGIRVKDSQGNFRDILDIMADFEKGTKGMGDVQRAAALKTIFGARAITGVNVLLAEGSDKLRDYRKDLINSGGAAEKMSKVIEKSLGNKIKAVFSALTEKGFQFLEVFDGQGRNGIDTLIENIRNFDMTPLVNGFKAFGSTVSFVYGIVQPFLPFMVSLFLAFKAYKAILFTTAIAQTAFGPIMAAAITAWKMYRAGVGIATIAQTGLNTAMKANPIGIVVTAVLALYYALKKLYSYWSSIEGKKKIYSGAAYSDELSEDELAMMKGSKLGTQGKGPITNRETLSQTIEKKEVNNTLDIRNKSDQGVDVNGKNLNSGFKRTLQPSGG